MKLIQQHLWFHQEVGTVQEIPCPSGCVVGFSERSPSNKSVNEDAVGIFVFDQQTTILAIADGMGGTNSGDRAAQMVIQSLAAQAELADSPDRLRTHVLDAIETANQEILGWGIGAGATVVVGLLIEERARIFHVGDAEALICSNRGRIKFSTVAHSPVAMAVEIGVLDEQEAMHHVDRNIVNNHVGSREMRIEIGPSVTLGLYDTLILASDGLFDNLMLSEIVEQIRGNELPRRAHNILERTRSRMQAVDASLPNKPDDLSVLLFRQQKTQPPVRVGNP